METQADRDFIEKDEEDVRVDDGGGGVELVAGGWLAGRGMEILWLWQSELTSSIGTHAYHDHGHSSTHPSSNHSLPPFSPIQDDDPRWGGGDSDDERRGKKAKKQRRRAEEAEEGEEAEEAGGKSKSKGGRAGGGGNKEDKQVRGGGGGEGGSGGGSEEGDKCGSGVAVGVAVRVGVRVKVRVVVGVAVTVAVGMAMGVAVRARAIAPSPRIPHHPNIFPPLSYILQILATLDEDLKDMFKKMVQPRQKKSKDVQEEEANAQNIAHVSR